MQRFLEIILGLPRGFLSQQGHFAPRFNPAWPWQASVGGAAAWNVLLSILALALVVYVYRREGRSRSVKICLGIVRGALLAFVLMLLNRPVLTLGREHHEPSVVALLIDDSLSMKVNDVTAANGRPTSRLDGVIDALTSEPADLLQRLAAVHDLRVYEFSRGQHAITSVQGPGEEGNSQADVPDRSLRAATGIIRSLRPDGAGTQVVSSLRSVLEDLQGQRLAGVVLFTDGRETPSAAPPEELASVKAFGANIYAVAVGTDRTPRNISIQAVNYEPSAFVDDITNLRVTVQASGYERDHPLTLVLERETTANGQKTREPVLDEHGQEISKTVTASDSKPFDVDLQFKPTPADMPTANLVVEAKPQAGELDTLDNTRRVQLAVLDNNISVIYVEGYPRWDYRYIKNSFLRDKTVKVSCLLTSADPAFRQEGSDDPNRPGKTWAITAFPTNLDQLLDYDVVLLGDVDPRQFTDAQLQMMSDFVSKRGGGLEMVAGPRWSPQAYKNTAIEAVLPVIISHTDEDDAKRAITSGFRPVLTSAGLESSIFRFFGDPAANAEFVKNHLQEVFWYCRGVIVKPGVGVVLAEHPSELGPDNRRAPLIVSGRFGAGRTLFSGIDDSWRWRYYTGESIFNTYWVEQLRYLARGRKLGQRRLTFTRDQDAYELGRQVTLQMRVLSPDLMQQVNGPLSAQIIDDATGQPMRRVELARQEGAGDVFTGSFTADRVGEFAATLPTIGDQSLSVSFSVEEPALELERPQVDLASLSRLASDAPIPLADAGKLPEMIHSAARVIPIETSQPLWNAPLAMIVFIGLITLEWVVRKTLGML